MNPSINAEPSDVDRLVNALVERKSLGLGQLQDFARRRGWTPERLAAVLREAVEAGRVQRFKTFRNLARYKATTKEQS